MVAMLLATLASAMIQPTRPEGTAAGPWRFPHMTFSCSLTSRAGNAAEVLADFSGDNVENRFAFRPLFRTGWPGTVVFRQARAVSTTRNSDRLEIVIRGSRDVDGAASGFELIFGVDNYNQRGGSDAVSTLEIRHLTHVGDEASGRCVRMPVLPLEISEE